jgi:5-methylcytosine-specific restriction endonuclease McrA
MEPMIPARKAIPKALREQVWLTSCGKVYDHSCYVRWCQNTVTVFDYHVGHDIPHSQGGPMELPNLKPICSRCNSSMGDKYTIQEWTRLVSSKKTWCQRLNPFDGWFKALGFG